MTLYNRLKVKSRYGAWLKTKPRALKCYRAISIVTVWMVDVNPELSRNILVENNLKLLRLNSEPDSLVKIVMVLQRWFLVKTRKVSGKGFRITLQI